MNMKTLNALAVVIALAAGALLLWGVPSTGADLSLFKGFKTFVIEGKTYSHARIVSKSNNGFVMIRYLVAPRYNSEQFLATHISKLSLSDWDAFLPRVIVQDGKTIRCFPVNYEKDSMLFYGTHGEMIVLLNKEMPHSLQRGLGLIP